MDFLDYREKLGIGFCDNEKYKFFLVKIFNILGEIALDTRFCGINASEYREFCRITGMEVDYKLLSEFIGPAGYRHWLSILRRVCEDPREFFAYYISLVNIVPEDREPDESGRFFERKGLIKLLTAMLAESHIGYNLINADGEYFVFPKGAVELDSALVSQPLAWLNQYPKAHTAFVKALREYSDATTENYSDIADKFRKALETFFQEFFKNQYLTAKCLRIQTVQYLLHINLIQGKAFLTVAEFRVIPVLASALSKNHFSVFRTFPLIEKTFVPEFDQGQTLFTFFS